MTVRLTNNTISGVTTVKLLKPDGVTLTSKAYAGSFNLTTQTLTDANAQIVSRYEFLPFGEEWNPASFRDPRLFAGKERDAESGFDYFGARHYQGQLGRFAQPDGPEYGDPFDPQSMNLYTYSFNNPLRYVDPDGHSGDCVAGYDAKTGNCEPVDPGLQRFIWESFTRNLGTAAQTVQQCMTAPRDMGCMANWIGAGAARGFAVGSALGLAAGGPAIIVTAPGIVAVNTLGGLAVGSVACMGNAGGQLARDYMVEGGK